MPGSARAMEPALAKANKLKYFSIFRVGYAHIQLHSLCGNTLNIRSKLKKKKVSTFTYKDRLVF